MKPALAHYDAVFAGAAARFPEAQRGARAASLARFLERGFPGKREEDWKYTDLSGLAAQSFQLPEPAKAPPALPSFAGTDRVAFIGGAPVSPAPPHVTLHDGFAGAATEGAITLLNGAFATSGVIIRVPAGAKQDRALHLLAWNGACGDPCMSHLRHRIELEAGAEAVVILHELGDASSHFSTRVCDVAVAEGARLTLYRLQEDGAQASSLGRIDATVARDGRLHVTTVDLGGGLTRNDLSVSLDGAGAEVELRGLYAPPKGAHTDNHTRIDHRAPHCRSFEHYRGVLRDAARAVFNGKIVVHEGAQKTDSEQRVANLLLAPGAEVNAKPELEIYADDVKCAHGATSGRLDEEAVYYLRSRGVDEAAARAVLTVSFAEEVLGGIALVPFKEHVERALRARLAGLR